MTPGWFFQLKYIFYDQLFEYQQLNDYLCLAFVAVALDSFVLTLIISQSAGLEFLEAEIHNKYLMATKVRVNRDRVLSSWYKNKQIWCFKDGFDGSRLSSVVCGLPHGFR